MPTDMQQILYELLLQRILNQATTQQPHGRSDLGGSFGSPDYLGPDPVATFMGRIVRPGDTISEVINRIPVDIPDAEGFGVGASLATLGPIVTKQQRQILRALNRSAPDLLESLRRLPQQIDIESGVFPDAPTASGVFTAPRTLKSGKLRINPEVLRGKTPTGEVVPQTDPRFIAGNLPAVVAHEAQHAVTELTPLFRGVSSHKLRRESTNILRTLIHHNIPANEGPAQILKSLLHDTLSGNREAMSEGLSYLRQAEFTHNIPATIRESIEQLLVTKSARR